MRQLGAAAWVAFGVLALAQIAIPLTDDDATIEWLSSLVVLAFAATALVLVTHHWGPTRALLAAGFTVAATVAVEHLGTASGIPFGDYEYTGALQPTVAGVPVIVPFAWFAMGVTALEVGHHLAHSRLVAVVAGALALTAWDLFLDPQMVDAGYWEWAAEGRYHGIPWTNYAGWTATGLAVLAVVDRVRPDGHPSDGLLALYTWWAVMSTVGFLVFFGEPDVGVVGGIGMGTVTALAWWRRANTDAQHPSARPIPARS